MHPVLRISLVTVAAAAAFAGFSTCSRAQVTVTPADMPAPGASAPIPSAAASSPFTTASIKCLPAPSTAAEPGWTCSESWTRMNAAGVCGGWYAAQPSSAASGPVVVRSYTFCGDWAMYKKSAGYIATIKNAKDPLKSLQTLDKRILVEDLSALKFKDMPKVMQP